jgi:hypothetical protein
VLGLYDKYKVNEESVKEMEHFLKLALESIKNTKASENKKADLVGFAEWLYKRDH